MSVSYSAYQPSGQLGSKLEHVIITFQKNEIPLFGRAVEVVGWQSIFIVILCTLKQTNTFIESSRMCIWFKIHDITQCFNNYIFAAFLDKTVFYNMMKGLTDTIVLILWKQRLLISCPARLTYR